ncbi:MAG: aromatic-ring-hydroxylating dioxygenase subunit beta [Armatimonadota bacterium]|nr:aromatic-ring-hydroxylating dioxygenase subunit beta [Armatimonadota bacterium]
MSAGPDVYHEITQFLYREAELLDSGRFDEWLDLLTDDITYHMPVRINRERGDYPDASEAMEHFSEDRVTLRLRVERLKTDFAWAEDPPSRTRRFVSNVRVSPGPDGATDVRSYLLIYRNRGDTPAVEILSAERRDVLVRVGRVWKIRRRTIIVDQASLGAKNLAIFF